MDDQKKKNKLCRKKRRKRRFARLRRPNRAKAKRTMGVIVVNRPHHSGGPIVCDSRHCIIYTG